MVTAENALGWLERNKYAWGKEIVVEDLFDDQFVSLVIPL